MHALNTALIAWIVFCVATGISIVIGWVINIIDVIDIVASGIEVATVELILRVVGIPIPILGAIMGYFV